MSGDPAYKTLIKRLHDFSLPLNLIEDEHERRIVTAVIRKLAQLDEHALFRVYKLSRVDGNSTLELRAYSGPKRGASSPTIVLNEQQRKGALSWCSETGSRSKGFWVEGIKKAADLSKLKNKFTNEEIGKEYTDFVDDPDTIIAIPLLAPNENVIGVFSVQFDEGRAASRQFVDILFEISSELARIMRKASETASYIRNTNDAIEGFLDDIMDLSLSPDILVEKRPIGFIIRPFTDEFNEIGGHIESHLENEGVTVSTYDPDSAGGIVASDLLRQISGSLFGIADITGANPNVLMEVGVVIASGKPLVIFRRSDDKVDVPFNVSGYYIHQYRQSHNGSIEIKRPQENRYREFGDAMAATLAELRSID